jgi:[CysO sulfur-carrier protein]-S-L-cysteine hydrolase
MGMPANWQRVLKMGKGRERSFTTMMAPGSSGAVLRRILRQVHRGKGEVAFFEMIRIPESICQAIVEHARRESPLECCGILSGREKTVDKVFELRNAEKSPVRYSISPLDQLRVFEEMEKESKEMIAIYHSHTHTIPFPSETDVKMAFYPEVPTIIISLKEENIPLIKAFRIGKEAIYLEEIEVVS